MDAETHDRREQVIATTKDLLNNLPDVDAFIRPKWECSRSYDSGN